MEETHDGIGTARDVSLQPFWQLRPSWSVMMLLFVVSRSRCLWFSRETYGFPRGPAHRGGSKSYDNKSEKVILHTWELIHIYRQK